ncbi:hydrolase [Halapricum hydrolyticum]|uniref:Hydrolase n=1 Tax=Halapricum hydrolyticum TaxID=2979991 RepID=A0AAE3I984_9EURY|nr:hydrolase [Halapricum hydrolyticum]MCU4716654.1 hydrolase [Halapricum hydrolyticum]MCU4725741.1 hydrolase [Halapricum hydrolyticum]
MEWRGAEVEPDGTRPEPESWAPVDVPGRPAQFAGAEAVAYRTVLEDPLSGPMSHAVLELRGCYGETTVWCDGERAATHDIPFTPFRVSLDRWLDSGDETTDVRVVCRRPTDGFGGIYETDVIPATESVPGIWWDATLRQYPGTYINQLLATPRLEGDKGLIDVRATVVADEPIDDRLTISVRPAGSSRGRGMMERVPIDAAAGERVTVEHTVETRDPALWWPADLGPQNRYDVVAKLEGMERTVTTGFSDVRYDGETLTVNGTETTLRGVNLLDATPADVTRAAATNANLVRTHAHVPSREVLETCETEGMLLWADLPLTGDTVPDVGRGRELAAALGEHYGRAASLAAVGVHDDPVNPFETPLGSGLLDWLRFRWRAWRASYDDSNARTIAEALPSSLLSVPVIGPPGIDADAATLYPGWRYGGVSDLHRLLDADVVAEFGAGSLATDDPEDLTGFDRRVHDSHVGDGLEASQRYQTHVVKRVAEGLRNDGVSILAAYALRDTGDAGMGVLGVDGEPKPAFDALATAFEPIQATLADPAGDESDVLVHNDLDTRLTGTLTWESPASTGETEVTVGTNATASVETIELPEGGAVTLTLSAADRTVENSYPLAGRSL